MRAPAQVATGRETDREGKSEREEEEGREGRREKRAEGEEVGRRRTVGETESNEPD
jgi:hypothetical protein